MKEQVSKIAASMQVDGDIVSDGELIVEGEFRGSFVGRRLIVSASGRIFGEIKVDIVECAGHLEGRVETKSLKLTKGGCQVGTVITGALEVESGAVIDCALQSGVTESIIDSPGKKTEKEVKNVDLTRYLTAFSEDHRPCCFEVPWSERWELYNQIIELLKKKKPLIQVVGESGSGKTTLVEKLLADSIDQYKLLSLEQRVGSVTTLLKNIASSLGLASCKKSANQTQIITEIRSELARRNKENEKVVLLMDGGEEMFQATMEGVIRLLSGACGEEDVEPDEYLQIILFGSQEMKSNMVATIIDYFEDETNCQLSLNPLNMKDTADYLRLGLQVASNGEERVAMSLLPNETIKEIHVRSRGSIAEINSIMNDILKRAHETGKNILSPE